MAADIPYILEVAFPNITASEESLLTTHQVTFCMTIVYIVMLAAVKASVLLFFIRVFITPFMQLASKITLGLVAAWAISFLGANIFLCHPVSAMWTGEGKCAAYIPTIQAMIATNALGDVIIMALPLRSIWSLHTRTTDKIGITSCFALGIA